MKIFFCLKNNIGATTYVIVICASVKNMIKFAAI